MAYRRIEMQVPLGCQQILEFKVGDRIRYEDDGFGNSGEGVISSFAQSGYDATVWYREDNGELKTVFLGWCEKVE